MNAKQLLQCCTISFFLISCQKRNTEIVQLNTAKTGLKERVIEFLEAREKKAGETAKAGIETLKGNIDWADFSESKQPFFNGTQTAFRIKNEHNRSGNAAAAYTCLYVTQNVYGNIVNISTLEINIPENNAENLNSLALKLVNNVMQGYTGTLTKRNLSGYYIYQIEIKNGTPESFRYLRKGNAGGRNDQSALTETCVDWYWQTYVNGVLVSEVYLFTDCGQNVEEGGSGNGGIGTGPVTNNPCEEVDSLTSNAALRLKLDSLRQGWAENYEIGYSYTGTPGGGFNFIKYQGLPGEGVYVPTNGPVRGIIHNHNQLEPFTIFSPDDLRRMFQLFYTNHADTGFSFVLITNNTAYILKVNDLAAFMQFGNNQLLDPASFVNFSFFTYPGYNIKENNPPASNELGFLRMLSGLNTGLRLFSASADFQDWDMKGVDPFNPNSIAILNCQ